MVAYDPVPRRSRVLTSDASYRSDGATSFGLSHGKRYVFVSGAAVVGRRLPPRFGAGGGIDEEVFFRVQEMPWLFVLYYIH